MMEYKYFPAKMMSVLQAMQKQRNLSFLEVLYPPFCIFCLCILKCRSQAATYL